jgi:UDP-2-acetamido-2,6-beta-L-arabino-hexul-4-ose reductase
MTAVMKKVLITGSKGFIGRNLLFHLNYIEGFKVVEYDIEQSRKDLERLLLEADFVFHLAGVNRSQKAEDFKINNSELTQFIIDCLVNAGKCIPIVYSSSTQAVLNNEYGKSKLEAEDQIARYRNFGGKGYVYRLSNVFGKWCQPNYNSVVATFCYNIANSKEIVISDRNNELNLIHIDDVVKEFIDLLSGTIQKPYSDVLGIKPSYKISLGELADLILSFKTMLTSVIIPNMENEFIKKLHSTYLSYVPLNEAIFSLNKQSDDRGYLFELIKSKSFGQIFVSKTSPGITRGNHFHHLKNEKFCVLDGSAVIKFRHLITNAIHEYHVEGINPQVVNILPGYTHSIKNTGKSDLITLFWANEPFDKEKPDTYFEKV